LQEDGCGSAMDSWVETGALWPMLDSNSQKSHDRDIICNIIQHTIAQLTCIFKYSSTHCKLTYKFIIINYRLTKHQQQP